MLFLRRILLLMMLALCAQTLRADTPATQPARTQREGQIRQWVIDLASPEAPIRQMARINLMALKPAELAELKKVSLSLAPLSRAQLESLKEVVGHLYLAGEVEKERNDNGFVGIRLGIGRNDFAQAGEGLSGIVVYRRIIGFVGYRMLQDGDIIVGLQEAPDLQMDQISDFTGVVSSRPPGDTIHLRVIRAGRELIVPITLDPRPAWANPGQRGFGGDDNPDQRYDQLITQANTYWASQFGRGIDPDLTDAPADSQ